jgi:hypothetical protein
VLGRGVNIGGAFGATAYQKCQKNLVGTARRGAGLARCI